MTSPADNPTSIAYYRATCGSLYRVRALVTLRAATRLQPARTRQACRSSRAPDSSMN